MDEKEIVNAYNNYLGIIKSAGEYIGKKGPDESFVSIANEAYVELQGIIDSTEPNTPTLKAIKTKKPQADALGSLLGGLKKNYFLYTKDLQETINNLALEDFRQSEVAGKIRDTLAPIKLYLETPKKLYALKMLDSLREENRRLLKHGKYIEDRGVQEELEVFDKLFSEYVQNLKTNNRDKPDQLYRSVERLEGLLKP